MSATKQTRQRFTATYFYPGVFMPEDVARQIPNGQFNSVIAAQPDNRWYAVEVRQRTERRYEAANGSEKWISEGDAKKVGSWIVGEKIHWEDIPDTEGNKILRSNIQGNSKDGYGVRTRCGNWQIASDWQAVLITA